MADGMIWNINDDQNEAKTKKKFLAKVMQGVFGWMNLEEVK